VWWNDRENDRRAFLGMSAPHWLPVRRIVASNAEVEVDPAALPFDLVDLALAVSLAAGLERQQLRILGQLLQPGQAVRRSGPGLTPLEVVVHANLLEPYLQWACPLAGCDFRAELPWPLERHAPVEHPEWTATFEDDPWRVLYRRSASSGEG
jgi:hypothetical protein